MNDEWKKALETVLSSPINEHNRMEVKHGTLEFIEQDKWMHTKLHLHDAWGYHTVTGWKTIDNVSIFPPMTKDKDFEDDNWFQPFKYAELLYMKVSRVYEFIMDNPQEKYELPDPTVIDNNVIYFQVMNLNSKWSSFTNAWTFDPDLTVFINGDIYPVRLSTKGLVAMMNEHKLLEVGLKITPTSTIQMEGYTVVI